MPPKKGNAKQLSPSERLKQLALFFGARNGENNADLAANLDAFFTAASLGSKRRTLAQWRSLGTLLGVANAQAVIPRLAAAPSVVHNAWHEFLVEVSLQFSKPPPRGNPRIFMVILPH